MTSFLIRSRRWVLVAFALVLTGCGPCSVAAFHAPVRPNGLTEIRNTFGEHCDSRANDGGLYWPWGRIYDAGAPFDYGFVWHNSALNDAYAAVHFGLIGPDGSGHVRFQKAVDNYNCRKIRDSNDWSMHSWGIAYDVNTGSNPLRQTFWNGVGWQGGDYGFVIPNWFQSQYIVHYWGLNFSRPDPMHFQYATGY